MTYPVVEETFGHWFAGFADGEGCFRIKPTNQGTYQCRFSIGVGILVHSGRDSIKQEQWRLEVNRKLDVARLVEVFDEFPLRAKKSRDFAIWREAVRVWGLVENGRRADWARMAELASELLEERRFKVVEACRGEDLKYQASSRLSATSSLT